MTQVVDLLLEHQQQKWMSVKTNCLPRF